jgi:hypothetical protein
VKSDFDYNQISLRWSVLGSTLNLRDMRERWDYMAGHEGAASAVNSSDLAS